MGSLSLNTSITSSHKEDFYSTGGQINGIYANYFGNGGNCPSSDWNWYVRIAENGNWKLLDTYCCNDYKDPECYTWLKKEFIYTLYYGNDIDYRKPIDKIAITYNGMRAESYVNRCNIDIIARDDNGLKAEDVEVYNAGATDSTSFYIVRCIDVLNATTKDCGEVWGCCDDITAVLTGCTGDVELMRTTSLHPHPKIGDGLIIGFLGKPTKLSWDISVPGVYDTGVIHYKYWDGNDWTYFVNAQDGTSDFNNSGQNDVIFDIESVNKWKRRSLTKEQPLYYCIAIWDSELVVTTIPKAKCLRWSGNYSFVTDVNGEFKFEHLSTPIWPLTTVPMNIIGKKPGYLCKSGCGTYNLTEGQDKLNIDVVVIKAELSCDITCPTGEIRQGDTRPIIISGHVSFGELKNSLIVTSPDGLTQETVTMGNIDKLPISYEFKMVGRYNFALTSTGGIDEVIICHKECYLDTIKQVVCSEFTDELGCSGESKCEWDSIESKCNEKNPHKNLEEIYTGLINGTKCIRTDCISLFDLNNDGKIDNLDLELSKALTNTEAYSMILSYDLCEESCPGIGGNTKWITIIILGVIIIGLYWFVLRK